jgi:2-oxoisovalerate dehydrogenase E1 component alpha subunit
MARVASFEIEYLQYLGPDGRLVREDLPEFALDRRNLVELFRQLLFNRKYCHYRHRQRDAV